MTDVIETLPLTTRSDRRQESKRLEDDSYDKIMPFIRQTTTTKLTNTAVFLHDNNDRIEGEVQFLMNQIQTLREVDEILDNIKILIDRISIVKHIADGTNNSLNRQHSFGNASTSVSISSSGEVWDESKSSTVVVNNTL
jgi:hypothetical protein